MRIDSLRLINFKGFEDQTFDFPRSVDAIPSSPNGNGSFHVLIGQNGRGKASTLDAVEDLRRLFPEVQFIATTHSPFIIQTLRTGELISLDTQSMPETGNLGVAQPCFDATTTALTSPRPTNGLAHAGKL